MTQNSQEDKEKKMENIIEDKDRISEKINKFQKKYKHSPSDDNDNTKSSAFGLAMRITTDLMSAVIIVLTLVWIVKSIRISWTGEFPNSGFTGAARRIFVYFFQYSSQYLHLINTLIKIKLRI